MAASFASVCVVSKPRAKVKGGLNLLMGGRMSGLMEKSDVNPVVAGIKLRCGQCGKGKLFERYLRLKETCDVCGRDMSGADTADGPAFFVGFFVLIVMAPAMVVVPMMNAPVWAKGIGFAVLSLAITGLCLALLPMAKAVLLNLQLHHDAMEVKADDISDQKPPLDM